MTPNTFEDRLLAELRAIVTARPAPATAQPVPRRPPRARLALGGVATAAAAAAAAVIATGGGSPEPAYAVERQADGDVTVTVNSLRDADGLERKLRAAGVPAVVDYTPEGKMCKSPRGTLTSDGKLTMGVSSSDGGATTFTVPRDLGSDRTLVIQASVGERSTAVGVDIVEGAVAPCELVDAPDPSTAPADGESGVAAGGADAGVQSLHTGP